MSPIHWIQVSVSPTSLTFQQGVLQSHYSEVDRVETYRRRYPQIQSSFAECGVVNDMFSVRKYATDYRALELTKLFALGDLIDHLEDCISNRGLGSTLNGHKTRQKHTGPCAAHDPYNGVHGSRFLMNLGFTQLTS
eukprot:5344535-Amphidinium_carterae.1